jgi:hypothetical protein
MSEAPGTHDPTFLPPDIPVPQDDGRARHLPGMKLPDLALPATSGGAVNLARLAGCAVLYLYPRTGVPGVDLPPDFQFEHSSPQHRGWWRGKPSADGRDHEDLARRLSFSYAAGGVSDRARHRHANTLRPTKSQARARRV